MLKNGNCLHFRHSLIGACLSSTNLIESIFIFKSEFLKVNKTLIYHDLSNYKFSYNESI